MEGGVSSRAKLRLVSSSSFFPRAQVAVAVVSHRRTAASASLISRGNEYWARHEGGDGGGGIEGETEEDNLAGAVGRHL